MSGTCKECKWWELGHEANLDDWQIFSPRDPDTHEKMQNMPEVRYCKSPKLVFGERPVEAEWAALIDGSGYAAGLITGADFGCVNFEKDMSQWRFHKTESGAIAYGPIEESDSFKFFLRPDDIDEHD